MTTDLRKPAKTTGSHPGPVHGRWLRACVSLALSLMLAAWLLLWFFESLSPRMDVIAGWETRGKTTQPRPRPACVVTGTLLCFTGLEK